MQTNQRRLEELLQKHNWTLAEKQWLIAYLEQSDAPLLRDLMSKWHNEELTSGSAIDPAISASMRAQIAHRTGVDMTPQSQRVITARKRIIYRWSAAACLLLAMATAVLFWIRDTSTVQQPVTVNREVAKPALENDVMPGGEKAVLTLSDGSSINLDSAGNGALATQGSARVVKLKDGRLAYESDATATPAVLYNTLTTPRGGQYQIALPDGSMVWLNAASSIRYPTSFTGTERLVEITGEAYFEVAKHPTRRFIVKLPNGNQVQVLGTHFNIYAYPDNTSMRTTLLEGSVAFSSGSKVTTLKPGEQLLLSSHSDITVVPQADIEEVMAWKNGLFNFKSADINTIMLQLSRWYDVDVHYEHQDANERFSAKIPRNTPISNVLKLLELTGEVGFVIEGKKVTVTH